MLARFEKLLDRLDSITTAEDQDSIIRKIASHISVRSVTATHFGSKVSVRIEYKWDGGLTRSGDDLGVVLASALDAHIQKTGEPG